MLAGSRMQVFRLLVASGEHLSGLARTPGLNLDHAAWQKVSGWSMSVTEEGRIH